MFGGGGPGSQRAERLLASYNRGVEGDERGAGMLQRDYLLEIIGRFTEAVGRALKRLAEGDEAATADIELEVAGLLDLDPSIALGLAPDSLVTMMILSGLGDSLAAYVCYALERVADAYEASGEPDLAQVRREQAAAVAESFNCDPSDVAAEFEQ